MSLLQAFFQKAVAVLPSRTPSQAQLIDKESHIGGQLFGKPSKGVSRRFFLDDGDSWFYSESAVDSSGQPLYNFTIRYQILPQGVLKSVDGKGHVFIKGIELDRLQQSIKLYEKRVMSELYSSQQPTQPQSRPAAV